MKLKKGQVVGIFLDYKEQKDYVGEAVLLIRNDNKSTFPPLSFFSKEENNKKEKINNYLLTVPTFEGESDGIEYKVKPIKEVFNMYSFEYWLVEFIDGNTYPINFRKWIKVRSLLGTYNTLKEMSDLSTGMNESSEIDDDED
jgi:hypothetical protein